MEVPLLGYILFVVLEITLLALSKNYSLIPLSIFPIFWAGLYVILKVSRRRKKTEAK